MLNGVSYSTGVDIDEDKDPDDINRYDFFIWLLKNPKMKLSLAETRNLGSRYVEYFIRYLYEPYLYPKEYKKYRSTVNLVLFAWAIATMDDAYNIRIENEKYEYLKDLLRIFKKYGDTTQLNTYILSKIGKQ